MVRKTVKDLDDEIVDLKHVMNDVKRKMDEVFRKYNDLEERVLSSIKDKNQGVSKTKVMLFLLYVKFAKGNSMRGGN